MKRQTLVEKFVSEGEQQRLLDQERFILEATECVARVMEKEGVSKSTLAKQLGKSTAFVTQVLGGGRNMTMRTLADILSVLGYIPVLTAKPRDVRARQRGNVAS